MSYAHIKTVTRRAGCRHATVTINGEQHELVIPKGLRGVRPGRFLVVRSTGAGVMPSLFEQDTAYRVERMAF